MIDDFAYAGIDTCAADGLCATACPVGINTGDFIKDLRAQSADHEGTALWIAEHSRPVETVGWGVRSAHAAQDIIGAKGVQAISSAPSKLTGKRSYRWNGSWLALSRKERDTPHPQAEGTERIIFFLLHLTPTGEAES